MIFTLDVRWRAAFSQVRWRPAELELEELPLRDDRETTRASEAEGRTKVTKD